MQINSSITGLMRSKVESLLLKLASNEAIEEVGKFVNDYIQKKNAKRPVRVHYLFLSINMTVLNNNKTIVEIILIRFSEVTKFILKNRMIMK